MVTTTGIANTTTTSVAEEARNAISADDNMAHPNRGSRKDKCNSSKKSGAGTRNRVAKKGPLYYGHRQREELLCLLRIQAYGPIL